MPEPWPTLDSTITYEDPWLRLRSDRCQTVAGRIIEPYHVLAYRDWVNVVALTAGREIVLVREYRHGVGAMLLSLPGGVVDGGESPLSAIQRELREETGFGGGDFFEVGRCYANPANQTNLVWSFLALGVERRYEQNLDANEEAEVVLEPFAAFLRETTDGPGVFNSMYLAAIYLALGFIHRSEDRRLDGVRRTLRAG